MPRFRYFVFDGKTKPQVNWFNQMGRCNRVNGIKSRKFKTYAPPLSLSLSLSFRVCVCMVYIIHSFLLQCRKLVALLYYSIWCMYAGMHACVCLHVCIRLLLVVKIQPLIDEDKKHFKLGSTLYNFLFINFKLRI